MVKILSSTHPGMRRAENQDAMACCAPQGGLPAWAFVCDGMGGHSGGSIAAGLAREHLASALERGLRPGMSSPSVQRLLEAAVENANAAIRGKAAETPDLKGMGTTVVAAVVLGSTLCLTHAGDSRAYLIRDGALTRLTKDHSLVQGLVDRGEITPKQARTHPERHYITKALGVARRVGPEYGECDLCPGDLVLLCSDGLHGMVAEEELPALCLQARQSGDMEPLIDRANQMGGADNITALLLWQED